MKTSGLPYKSHMPLDVFRVGDRVTPTYGRLRGVPGTVEELRSSKFGAEMVMIKFDRAVQKYSKQEAQWSWAYEPDRVRLESFATAKV